MTELKRWGDERPDKEKPFILYRQGQWGGTWCRRDLVLGELGTYTQSQEEGGVSVVWPPTRPNDRWCYVSDAPDWSKIDD